MIEYSALSESDKNKLLESGIYFLQTVTDIAGAENGMSLWTELQEHLGQEFQQEVFLKLLQGNTSSCVNFVVGTSRDKGNVVETIREIRRFTGVSIGKAKELYDASETSIVNLTCKREYKTVLEDTLQYLGCVTY